MTEWTWQNQVIPTKVIFKSQNSCLKISVHFFSIVDTLCATITSITLFPNGSGLFLLSQPKRQKCWPMVKILSYMSGTRGKCCRLKVLMNDEATIRFQLMALAPISNACARSSRTKSHSAFWPYRLHGNSVYMSMQRGDKKTRFSSHIIWSVLHLLSNNAEKIAGSDCAYRGLL